MNRRNENVSLDACSEEDVVLVAMSECDPINVELQEHQTRLNDWIFSDKVADLHCWVERMNSEFKLQIPLPCLAIDGLRRAYGHFRRERNGFGLRDEIAIDEEHARNSAYWLVLGALLHELLHPWQHRHRKAGETITIKSKALSLGLVVEHIGATEYLRGDTPFHAILRKYGVVMPEGPSDALSPHNPARMKDGREKAEEKLKLWECPCGVKVRVGRSRFNAQCLDCDGRFQLKP